MPRHEAAMTDSMRRRARFSRCRTFRTALGRTWDPALPSVGFVGLNPSTADASRDDPTLRRCIGFSRRLGAGSLVLVNLFAYRATRPRDLWSAGAPVGRSTDRVMREELRTCARVVVAWGNIPVAARPRARTVLALLDRLGATVVHLGRTKAGHPRHPLYTRADAPLHPWGPTVRGAPYLDEAPVRTTSRRGSPAQSRQSSPS